MRCRGREPWLRFQCVSFVDCQGNEKGVPAVDFRGQRLPCARPRAQIHRVGLGRFTGSMRNTVCYEIVAN
jgi:hypothetical protein